MEFETQYITPEIKLSEFKGKFYKTEAAFEHHILVWLMAGETKVVQGEATWYFGAGDIFLIPRHLVATFINYHKDGQYHKSVAMHLIPERLKAFYVEHPPKAAASGPQKIIQFSKHPLLESGLASLIPYFDMQEAFPEKIASLKITEAINVLRIVDPGIDAVLANFDEPGKIGLSSFMETHFMYNLPLEKFSYLSGRSLPTFHRDFRKAYNTTPQKWLTQKRLESAHYQIEEKKKRPVDVYLEVGFEDLSHFSFAFKKQFGYSPAELAARSAKA